MIISEPCCQAQTAECLACKAHQTVEEYCRLNPQTTGCPRGIMSKNQFNRIFNQNTSKKGK